MKYSEFIVTIEGGWLVNDKRVTKRMIEKELRAAVKERFEYLARKTRVTSLPKADNWADDPYNV